MPSWGTAEWIGRPIAIPAIRRRAGACITITVITIRHTGYSTGSHGRIAAVPFVIRGARISRSASSGRTIIADLSLSASAVTGRTTITGVITGTGGIPTRGTGIILRGM